MDLQLTGRTALVTGGTRGIGRAIVEGFVAEGANVAFCARTEADVRATEEAVASSGPRAVGSVVDVGDAEALSAWVAATAEAFGGIDIVVSNVSALAIPDTDENWELSLNVDLMGTVRLVKAAMPHLEASEVPAIVTISSVSGREVDFASGPYGTAKAAIIAYTQGLAHQLAGKGIRANSVSPGNTYFEGGVWEGIESGNAEMFEMAMGLNPTGRMGRPEEMAAGVVFLASPVSSFTTGSNLVIDGALTRGIQL
jgi:3-oxoacyl-[acyl-carrier protein] reductase